MCSYITLTPHPSSLTVSSKGISPPNDITCSCAYMAMLCVQSVLQATNAHYVLVYRARPILLLAGRELV